MKPRIIGLSNYAEKEGDCECGCGLKMTDDLVLALQAFNAILSRVYGCPVRHLVTSGARCAKRNAATPNSSPFSQHVLGLAADGYWEKKNTHPANNPYSQCLTENVAAEALRSGLFGGVGWKMYEGTSGIIHLDIRPGACVAW